MKLQPSIRLLVALYPLVWPINFLLLGGRILKSTWLRDGDESVDDLSCNRTGILILHVGILAWGALFVHPDQLYVPSTHDDLGLV